jgi:hypothetical protein
LSKESEDRINDYSAFALVIIILSHLYFFYAEIQNLLIEKNYVMSFVRLGLFTTNVIGAIAVIYYLLKK